MPKNKVVYNKDLDMSYIMSPDGKTQIGHMEGDQTNNPLVYQSNASDVQNIEPPYTSHTIPDKIAQMSKNIVVNAASEGPMMMAPEIGLPMALAASLGLGGATDKAIFPEHDVPTTVMNALANTTIGGLTEGFANRGLRVSPPPILGGGNLKQAGLSKVSALRNFLPSITTDPMAATVEDSIGKQIAAIPAPATRGPGGTFLSAKQLAANQTAHAAAIKQTILDSVMNRLKTSGKSMLGNTAFDALFNSTPDNQPQPGTQP